MTIPSNTPSTRNASPTPAGARTSPARVHVSRQIAATPEVLFAAWLDPESLAAWLRPGRAMRTIAKTDPVVGGKFQIDMHGAEQVYPHQGTYIEIDPPHRLVFTWASIATRHLDTLVTVEFKLKGAMTEVSITHEQLPENENCSHTEGWTDALALLAEHVARDS